jgi:glycosyltransferase involved in cell wall biosynthesis
MEVFSRVARYRDDVTLLIRSDVPWPLIRKYSDLIKSGRIIIISSRLQQDKLEYLYKSSDIFFFPSHYESWQIILEASSFEMPVLALNIEGTSEIVEDGVSGYLVPESESVPQSSGGVPLPTLSPQVRRAIFRGPFQEQVDALEEKLALLIDSEKLRRKMGKAGRFEVDNGKHSISSRNEILKQVFDEALTDQMA